VVDAVGDRQGDGVKQKETASERCRREPAAARCRSRMGAFIYVYMYHDDLGQWTCAYCTARCTRY